MPGFDPFAADVIADPYPHYRRLREDGVAYLERFDTYVVSTYAGVSAAIRDHAGLSSAEGITMIRAPLPMMLTMDPPDHTRLRRIVGREFSPRRTQDLRPTVERMVSAAFDEMLTDGGGEIVERLAVPLPIGVMGSILGLPDEDLPELRRMADDLVEGFTLQSDGDEVTTNVQRTVQAIVEIHGYFRELIARKRAAPADDLLSRMLLPAEDEGALTEDELLWFCLLLTVAGIETTTNLIGNMTIAFLDHPEQLEAVRSAPALCASAVNEVLRYDSPIQGFYRTAMRPYAIGDVEAPTGARVLVLYGAANRDPAHYPDGDRFDVARNPTDHLAFGGGIHRCLGAGLAELEGCVVLEQLIARVAKIEPAGEIVRTGHPTLRGARVLPVSLVAA